MRRDKFGKILFYVRVLLLYFIKNESYENKLINQMQPYPVIQVAGKVDERNRGRGARHGRGA